MITKLNRCPMVLKKLGSQTSVDDRYIRLSDAGIRDYKKIPAASCISYKSVRPELLYCCWDS